MTSFIITNQSKVRIEFIVFIMKEEICAVKVSREFLANVGDIVEMKDPVKLGSLFFCRRGFVTSNQGTNPTYVEVIGVNSNLQTIIPMSNLRVLPKISFNTKLIRDLLDDPMAKDVSSK